MSVATMPGLSVPVSDSRTNVGVSRVDWIEERVAEPVPTPTAAVGPDEDPFHDRILRGIGLVMILVGIPAAISSLTGARRSVGQIRR